MATDLKLEQLKVCLLWLYLQFIVSQSMLFHAADTFITGLKYFKLRENFMGMTCRNTKYGHERGEEKISNFPYHLQVTNGLKMS